MANFICTECEKTYNESNFPKDSICQDVNCPGGGLTGLVIPNNDIPDNIASLPPEKIQEFKNEQRLAGLCILLMDASGSMDEIAYSEHSFPSKYDSNKPLSKREVISDIAAQGVFQLDNMANKENAYIMAIKFDHSQSVMFTETVESIIKKHQTPQNFAKYFYDELSTMGGGTDINSVLTMSKSFVTKFLDCDVPGMGNYSPIMHTEYSSISDKPISIPNVRVLIYTDGEQGSKINSPFKIDTPDLLMGVYIGNENGVGCKDLREVISKCHMHNEDQFFIFNKPQQASTLRGIFRMASGTSGFCPKCLK